MPGGTVVPTRYVTRSRHTEIYHNPPLGANTGA